MSSTKKRERSQAAEEPVSSADPFPKKGKPNDTKKVKPNETERLCTLGPIKQETRPFSEGNGYQDKSHKTTTTITTSRLTLNDARIAVVYFPRATESTGLPFHTTPYSFARIRIVTGLGPGPMEFVMAQATNLKIAMTMLIKFHMVIKQNSEVVRLGAAQTSASSSWSVVDHQVVGAASPTETSHSTFLTTLFRHTRWPHATQERNKRLLSTILHRRYYPYVRAAPARAAAPTTAAEDNSDEDANYHENDTSPSLLNFLLQRQEELSQETASRRLETSNERKKKNKKNKKMTVGSDDDEDQNEEQDSGQEEARQHRQQNDNRKIKDKVMRQECMLIRNLLQCEQLAPYWTAMDTPGLFQYFRFRDLIRMSLHMKRLLWQQIQTDPYILFFSQPISHHEKKEKEKKETQQLVMEVVLDHDHESESLPAQGHDDDDEKDTPDQESKSHQEDDHSVILWEQPLENKEQEARDRERFLRVQAEVLRADAWRQSVYEESQPTPSKSKVKTVKVQQQKQNEVCPPASLRPRPEPGVSFATEQETLSRLRMQYDIRLSLKHLQTLYISPDETKIPGTTEREWARILTEVMHLSLADVIQIWIFDVLSGFFSAKKTNLLVWNESTKDWFGPVLRTSAAMQSVSQWTKILTHTKEAKNVKLNLNSPEFQEQVMRRFGREGVFVFHKDPTTGLRRALLRSAQEAISKGMQCLMTHLRQARAFWPVAKGLVDPVHLSTPTDPDSKARQPKHQQQRSSPLFFHEHEADTQRLCLHLDQRAVLRALENHPAELLTGGPGTGKTSTIKCIRGAGFIRSQWKALGGKRVRGAAASVGSDLRLLGTILILAPVNSVCGYIRTMMHETCVFTPHFILESLFHSTRRVMFINWLRHIRVVIFEEINMWAMLVFFKTLSVILPLMPHRPRLIFLGDTEQLSSVDEGSIIQLLLQLSKWIPDLLVHKNLEFVFRAGQGTTLGRAWQLLRTSKSPDDFKEFFRAPSWINSLSYTIVPPGMHISSLHKHLLWRWVANIYLRPRSSSQLISYTNEFRLEANREVEAEMWRQRSGDDSYRAGKACTDQEDHEWLCFVGNRLKGKHNSGPGSHVLWDRLHEREVSIHLNDRYVIVHSHMHDATAVTMVRICNMLHMGKANERDFHCEFRIDELRRCMESALCVTTHCMEGLEAQYIIGVVEPSSYKQAVITMASRAKQCALVLVDIGNSNQSEETGMDPATMQALTLQKLYAACTRNQKQTISIGSLMLREFADLCVSIPIV